MSYAMYTAATWTNACKNMLETRYKPTIDLGGLFLDIIFYYLHLFT